MNGLSVIHIGIKGIPMVAGLKERRNETEKTT